MVTERWSRSVTMPRPSSGSVSLNQRCPRANKKDFGMEFGEFRVGFDEGGILADQPALEKRDQSAFGAGVGCATGGRSRLMGPKRPAR